MYNKGNKFMYHISDLKKYLRCPRFYFLDNDKDASFLPYLRVDESISELIKKHFRIKDAFEGQVNDPNSCFIENLNNYEWFIKSRFEVDGLRVNIPLIHKIGDYFDLFFVVYSTTVKESDLFGMSISLNVFENFGYKVKSVYSISVDEHYTYHQKLDVDRLFNITCLNKGLPLIEYLHLNKKDPFRIIEDIENHNGDVARKTRACHERGSCPYYYQCFEKEKDIPDDSILTLVSSKDKQKMFDEGIIHLKDADINRIEGGRLQYAQIMASHNGGLFIDKLALKTFMTKLAVRPLSFIDFEWDRYLVPKYENMRPLDVICFEFILYVLDEQGELKHYSFIANEDCRRDFIEALIKYLPKDGPILAYNALGAEKLRLLELSRMFPEYASELEEMAERFIDLAIPFVDGLVYDTRFRGNFTLKNITDIISDYSYRDLNISDGMKAVYSWRQLDKKENNENIMSDLIEYCSLDAYGLYLLYKWLLSLLN